MAYYQAFGVGIESSINLTALTYASDHTDIESLIHVSEGKCPETLLHQPTFSAADCQLNKSELLLTVPGIARYYIQQGKNVTIEPFCTNWPSILLYFYSNCLATIFLQRNQLILHVAGVFIKTNEVLLLAAPSRTGKSTTALKLAERGYPLFTDDTAIVKVIDKKCVARASYPMSKLWSETITQQQIYIEANKQPLYASDLDKFGFLYHDSFVDSEVQVRGIVFLEQKGDDIQISRTSQAEQIGLTGINIYRSEWAIAMQKQQQMFELCTSLARSIPAWRACRPSNVNTFDLFAAEIDKQVLKGLSGR